MSLRCLTSGFPRPKIEFRLNDEVIIPGADAFENFMEEYFDQVSVSNLSFTLTVLGNVLVKNNTHTHFGMSLTLSFEGTQCYPTYTYEGKAVCSVHFFLLSVSIIKCQEI